MKKKIETVDRWHYHVMESDLLNQAVDTGDDDAIALAMALEMFFDDCKPDILKSYTITVYNGGGDNVGIGI